MPFIVNYESLDREVYASILDRPGIIPGNIEDLIPYGDDSFHCLPYIDPYDTTYFTKRQMAIFLSEWERVKARAETPAQLVAWDSVYQLAKCVAEHPHSFLVFRGD